MWLSRTEFHPGNLCARTKVHGKTTIPHFGLEEKGRAFAKPRLAGMQNRRKNAESNANNLA